MGPIRISQHSAADAHQICFFFPQQLFRLIDLGDAARNQNGNMQMAADFGRVIGKPAGFFAGRVKKAVFWTAGEVQQTRAIFPLELCGPNPLFQ